jgi:hypothetical protein
MLSVTNPPLNFIQNGGFEDINRNSAPNRSRWLWWGGWSWGGDYENHWEDRPEYVRSGKYSARIKCLGRIERVAPLLCRLERDYQEEGFVHSSNPRVIAHSFVKRSEYSDDARYTVLASLDGFESQTLTLSVTHSGRVYDMIDRKDITGTLPQLELAAGEGRLLLVGSRQNLDQDCAMIDKASKGQE